MFKRLFQFLGLMRRTYDDVTAEFNKFQSRLLDIADHHDAQAGAARAEILRQETLVANHEHECQRATHTAKKFGELLSPKA